MTVAGQRVLHVLRRSRIADAAAQQERTRLVVALHDARSGGLTWSRIARAVLIATNGRATNCETKREAERLRKLVERTTRPRSSRRDPRRAKGMTEGCVLEEKHMANDPTPRLRRRTIVEEYDDDDINTDGLDGLDDEPDDQDEERDGGPDGP